MKTFRATIAFHSRIEQMVIRVRDDESLIDIKNQLETTPRILALTEVKNVDTT